MATSYKNIVITPNISNTSDPKIAFSGANSTVNTDITLNVYPDSNGTLSFEGTAGQLFSITNDLSNSLFSVNDVSGIPSLEVFANGLVSVAPLGGNVVFGNTSELILSPGAGLYANASLGTAGQTLYSNGSSIYWATPTVGDITSVIAGAGLITGGTSGDVTLDVGAGTGITVSADAVAVNAAYIATITANNATFINGNTVLTVMESLRANRNISGGGNIAVDGSYNVLWPTRFIVMANGRGTHFSTTGYFDVTCPTSGTITGVGGAPNKTATAAGIPLAAWEALYYILPIGSDHTSVAANFRVVNYQVDVEIPSSWILICVRNSDTGQIYFNNGVTLTAGQSYNTTSFNSAVAPYANNSGNLNGKTEANLNVNAAAQLVTTRSINGVNFNGTANILVPSTYDANYRRIDNPGGAEYVTTTATITGAIQITLPVGWTNSMIRMTVRVYEYSTNKSFDVVCGGYNYSVGYWVNIFAYILGDKDVDRRFGVRFGYNASGKCVIYIGELASTWSYPQVYVTDVQVGYSGQSATWVSGWAIGFQASAFENVTDSVQSTQVGYGTSTSTADALVLRDASFNFAANNITANTTGIHTGNVSATSITVTDLVTLSTNSTYRKRVITTLDQGANNTTYELARISRDSTNWTVQFLEITAFNRYYRSGKTKWNITYNQVDAGTITCEHASGTIMHKVYLGAEVLVSGTIYYRPVLIDLPQYTQAAIEINYGYGDVTSITNGSQIYFTNTYVTNASASASYSGDIHLNPSGGNTGIGTASPSYKLHVTGTAYASLDFRAPIFYDFDNTAYYLDPLSTSNLNTVQAVDAFRSDRFEDLTGNFFFREGVSSGVTRHLNLSDSNSDPSTMSSDVGISWGARSDNNPYYMIWTSNYNNGFSTHSRLRLGWHTGMEIGAATNYGGVRFFDNSPGISGTSELMSIGKSDTHVRVVNNLYSKIYYDIDNTAFYTDPAAISNLNTLNVGSIGWNTIIPQFGQRSILVNELTDLLYQADKRFTVTNGSNVLFDGDFGTNLAIPISTTRVININVANQSGVPAAGITYPEGYFIVSFYYTENIYSSITLRTRHNGTWITAAAPTDISTNINYKVLQFSTPGNNYLTDFELTVVTNATNQAWLSSLNYVGLRLTTTELELPFVSKHFNSNYLFGSFGVKNNTGGINNLLSGTASSYLSATAGSVGIGNAAPGYKLDVTGTAYASADVRAPIFYDSGNTGYYVDPAGATNLFNLYIQGGVANPIASAQYYDAAIEVREFAFGGAQTDSWSYAPRIGFHWSGRTAAQIGMSSGSRIHMLNSDASGYVQLQSGNFFCPIFYDSDNTNFYADLAGTGTSLQIAGAIKQGNNFAHPNIEWSASGASTGMIIFSLPGASANYGMVHMVFDIYEYVAGKIATVIVGGHNWSGAWYETGCQVIGNLDKTVRLGFKDGKYCVVFGGAASTWTYGTIRLRKIHNGGFYDNIIDLGGVYTAAQTTTESFTVVTGDLRQLRTPGTFQADGDIRAPIFYDVNNTAYYVDPATATNLNGTLTVATSFTANSTLVNAAAINITGRVNTATFFATTSANVGANVLANTSAVFVGNTTVYAYQTKDGFFAEQVGVNSSDLGSDQLYFSVSAGGYGQYTPSSLTLVGAGATPNSVSLSPNVLQIGNSSVTSNLFSSSLAISNFFNANSLGVYHTGTVNAASHTIDTTLIANTLGVYHTGTMNAASLTVGTSFIANTTGAYHTGTVNAASFTVGTSFTANSTVVNAVAYYAGTLLVGNTTVVNATHLSGTAGSGYQTTAGLSANVATLTSNNANNLGGVAAAAYLSNTANKTISGGFAVTAYNRGTVTTTNTYSVDATLGNYQYYTSTGTHTLAAPTSDCAVDILLTNGVGASTITFSGFTVGTAVGSPYANTNAQRYLFSIRRINSISTYSIYALQ